MNRPQFEYRKIIDTYLTETELNKLGEDGWELCGVLYNGNHSLNPYDSKAYFYFKRIKQNYE